MNVNDQWMLERMQQMAASMAALPQTPQDTQTPKTEKGDSFKDLMDKAKDQKLETPEKAGAPRKDDPVQKTEKPETVQKTEQPRKAELVKNPDGTTTAKVELTAVEAAMIAAGYSQLHVQEDGTVFILTAINENGQPVLPAIYLEQYGKGTAPSEWPLIQNGDQWVIEPSEDLSAALEELLQQLDDPRSASSIMDALTAKFQEAQSQGKTQVVISSPETEQADEEDLSDLSGEVKTAQPLFKDVKAAPVKVGENFQLDTTQPDMDEQLANTIQQAAQQGLKQIEIRLTPENLGALTIKLTQSTDGTLQVVLHTANPKTASLLTQHIDTLNAALQGYSQNEVHVEVQRSENSQQSEQQFQQADPDGHNQQQQQNQRRRQDTGSSEDFVQRLRLGLFQLEEL